MIEVRIATAEEWPLVHQIMLEAFEEYRGVLDPPSAALSETLEDVRSSVANGGSLLAFMEGQPAGSARYALHEDHAYCSRLAVLPSKRRLGVAGAMLDFIEQTAKGLGIPEVRLSTREVMESNLKLYERQGYTATARSPHPKGGGIVVDFAKRVSSGSASDTSQKFPDRPKIHSHGDPTRA